MNKTLWQIIATFLSGSVITIIAMIHSNIECTIVGAVLIGWSIASLWGEM